MKKSNHHSTDSQLRKQAFLPPFADLAEEAARPPGDRSAVGPSPRSLVLASAAPPRLYPSFGPLDEPHIANRVAAGRHRFLDRRIVLQYDSTLLGGVVCMASRIASRTPPLACLDRPKRVGSGGFHSVNSLANSSLVGGVVCMAALRGASIVRSLGLLRTSLIGTAAIPRKLAILPDRYVVSAHLVNVGNGAVAVAVAAFPGSPTVTNDRLARPVHAPVVGLRVPPMLKTSAWAGTGCGHEGQGQPELQDRLPTAPPEINYSKSRQCQAQDC